MRGDMCLLEVKRSRIINQPGWTVFVNVHIQSSTGADCLPEHIFSASSINSFKNRL